MVVNGLLLIEHSKSFIQHVSFTQAPFSKSKSLDIIFTLCTGSRDALARRLEQLGIEPLTYQLVDALPPEAQSHPVSLA